MPTIKKKDSTNKPKTTNYNIRLGEKLNERAVALSKISGLNVTSLMRNGLDMLLKANNL